MQKRHNNTNSKFLNLYQPSSFISIALALGIVMSPDTLVMLGNGVGAAGYMTLVFVIVGIIVNIATVDSFRILHLTSGNHIKGFQRVLGRRCATILMICGKLPLAVCASAGLVVSAGFVLNEVFVYWFPNFAFAFMLLGLAAIVNMLNNRAKFFIQIIAVFGVVLGLFILIGYSIFNRPPTISSPPTGVSFDYRYLLAVVALLVGFDMGLYADWKNSDSFTRQSRALVSALIAGGLLLVLWGFASLAVVPPVKLESSSIPHMIMARKALGQPGRLIMGVVIICGVFAAVNSLVHSTSTMIKQINSANGNSRRTNHSTIGHRVTIFFISGCSAVLMAMGMAGESILETWIRSSLFLWLLYYIFVSISAYMAWRHTVPLSGKNRPMYTILAKVVSVIGTAAAAIGIVLLEPERSDMLVFLAAVIIVVTMVVGGVDFFSDRVGRMKKAFMKA